MIPDSPIINWLVLVCLLAWHPLAIVPEYHLDVYMPHLLGDPPRVLSRGYEHRGISVPSLVRVSVPNARLFEDVDPAGLADLTVGFPRFGGIGIVEDAAASEEGEALLGFQRGARHRQQHYVPRPGFGLGAFLCLGDDRALDSHQAFQPVCQNQPSSASLMKQTP